MASSADFLTVDSALELLSIGIGIAIFVMQRRGDAKINRIIRTQFRRQELVKKYFGTRIISNLEQVKKNYLKLGQYLGDYISDRSAVSKNRAKNFCVFQSNNLDEFVVPSLRGDLEHLIEFLDDLKLVDELTLAFDDFSSLYKDCSVDATFEDSSSSLKEKVESAHDQSKLIDSLLSRFAEEIPKTVE